MGFFYTPISKLEYDAVTVDYKPPLELLNEYILVKLLPNGVWCGVLPLLFHYTIHVDIDDVGYADRWCIDTREHAIIALLAWDGTGEPMFWHKHVGTGRRRRLSDGVIWHESEKEPGT